MGCCLGFSLRFVLLPSWNRNALRQVPGRRRLIVARAGPHGYRMSAS